MSTSYIYGLHAVKKMLQISIENCESLHCLKNNNNRLQQVISLAVQKKLSIKHVSRDQLSQLVNTDKHQGCVLQISERNAPTISIEKLLQEVSSQSLFLILDGVQDPHNLGACLRTADAAGVSAVFIPKDRAAGISAIVRKVAAGAAETVPVITVTNINRTIKQLQQAGVWLYGASGEADSSLYDCNFQGATALVMGAEGDGLRRLTAEACDQLIKIPMLGQVESLNVSVATGVCLYEIIRSRSTMEQ